MNWKKTTIGEHCTVTSSKRFHLSERTNCGVPFYCAKEIIQKIRSEEIDNCDYISEELYKAVAQKFGVPQRNDLLVTTRGTIGIPYLYKESDRFYFADGNLTWMKDFRDTLLPQYLYYWFLSHEGQSKIDSIAKGTAQKAVPIAGIKTLELLLPPIETQRRIADILSAYDDLIENNRKQIKLLEEAAQQLYQEWFVDLRFPGHEHTKIVDGVPEGWDRGVLNNIVNETGRNIKKENRQEYTYYLPIDYLPKKSIGYVDTNDIKLAESSLVSFDKGDIIFGAMRPYFHKVVVARDKGLTRSTCFVLNSRAKNMWGYVTMLLFDVSTIEYATKISVGTTMPYVRWKDMQLMPVLIPNQQIAASFDSIVQPIITKVGLLAHHISALREARDHLLPKLVSGEVEV